MVVDYKTSRGRYPQASMQDTLIGLSRKGELIILTGAVHPGPIEFLACNVTRRRDLGLHIVITTVLVLALQWQSGILEALAVTGCMLASNLDAFKGLRRHQVWDLSTISERSKHLLIIQTNIAGHTVDP